MDPQIVNLLHIYHTRVRDFSEEGNWKEAFRAADAAIAKAREAHEGASSQADNLKQLSFSIEIKGDLLRRTGEMAEARLSYLQALKLLEGKPRYTEQMARISASLAVLYDHMENEPEAMRFYKRAIDLFNRLDPPSFLDIADLYNNLAFMHRDQGDFEQAESLFLEALEICNKEFGMKHEETALICNNLGVLYSQSGHHGQARKMQKVALEARQFLCGEDHLDTAQSHANLAIAEAATGNPEAARRHFTAAIATFEAHLKEAPSDYAAVAANYIEFLTQQGNEKEALALEKKSGKNLKNIS